MPLTLKQFPLPFRNGRWSEKLFKGRTAKKLLDMKKVESIEKRMLDRHLAAVKEARYLLCSGGNREKAAALLEKAFTANIKLAEENAGTM